MKEPTSYAVKVLRSFLIAVAILIPLEAYQFAHLPPAGRQGRAYSLAFALVMFAVIAVLTVRKRASSPDNPRLSPFTLLGIAAIGIIVAILFRPSRIRGVTAPDLQTSSGMGSQQVSGLFILAGGIFITLWAYGIVAPSQRERLDPAMVQRLKWLGPLTLVLGLCEFLFHVRS
jgi:hypothetical protein